MAIMNLRVFFALALVATGVRIDEGEDPTQAEKCSEQGAESRTPPEDPQQAGRAAAVGAHAAGKSPSEVVAAAAQAAKVAADTTDPASAKHHAELAAEHALGTAQEISDAGAKAYAYADQRKDRTQAELAAADVAKAAQDAAQSSGDGFAASIAAHAKAMDIETRHGSGQGYMYGLPAEPEKAATPGIAMTRGLYAMWAAHRAGEPTGSVVVAAVDAVKHAGGTPSDVADVSAIASDPLTFEHEDHFTDAKQEGLQAAIKAQKAGWPLQHVAVAAARAAGDAQQSNPDQTPEDALQAARQAAESVMSRKHQSPAEVAAEAAEKAKKEAEDSGHPPAQVAQLTASAAAAAAGRRGAPADLVAKLAEDARQTVSMDGHSHDYDTRQWNDRVYAEYEKGKSEEEDLRAALHQ